MKIQNIVKSIAARILFFVVFLLCANTLFAQIQTKILGCRVGTSTENEVVAILQQQGYTVYYGGRYTHNRGEFCQFYGSILFGGVCWDMVTFSFISRKLVAVSFHCSKPKSDTFNRLLSDLKNKYSRYYQQDKSDKFSGEHFEDSYTEVVLRRWGGIELVYSNIKLQDAMYGGVYNGGASDL